VLKVAFHFPSMLAANADKAKPAANIVITSALRSFIVSDSLQ
jgi:hypothetical protein